jgi:hypothetical protein
MTPYDFVDVQRIGRTNAAEQDLYHDQIALHSSFPADAIACGALPLSKLL